MIIDIISDLVIWWHIFKIHVDFPQCLSHLLLLCTDASSITVVADGIYLTHFFLTFTLVFHLNFTCISPEFYSFFT